MILHADGDVIFIYSVATEVIQSVFIFFVIITKKVKVLVAQLYLTLANPWTIAC